MSRCADQSPSCAARPSAVRPRSPTLRRALAELRAQFNEQELVAGQIAEQERVEREVQTLVGDTQRQIAALHARIAVLGDASREFAAVREELARRDELEALARRLDGVVSNEELGALHARIDALPASDELAELREPPRGPRRRATTSPSCTSASTSPTTPSRRGSRTSPAATSSTACTSASTASPARDELPSCAVARARISPAATSSPSSRRVDGSRRDELGAPPES